MHTSLKSCGQKLFQAKSDECCKLLPVAAVDLVVVVVT